MGDFALTTARLDSLLQCIDCAGELSRAESDLYTCAGCGRAYPLDDGIIQAMDPLEGANQAAVRFYDGPWWKRYRQRERVAFALAGGEGRFRRRLLSELPSLIGGRLLDVGIGDGANIPYLNAECEIYGVDISQVQLRKCLGAYPSTHLQLLRAQAERLPFRDASFDHAITVGAFNLFNDRRGALLEMIRVVRPGGTILVLDEVPSLVGKLPGRYIGLPGLDRWLLANAIGVGGEFAALLNAHRDDDVISDARALLENVRLQHYLLKTCYCFIGTVPHDVRPPMRTSPANPSTV